jgi:hypothetical protein
MNLPQMFLKFCKEGITLEIYEYFRRCTANQPEQWCSIISASKELSDNDIVLYLLLKASQGCMSFYDFSFETLYSYFNKKRRSDN